MPIPKIIHYCWFGGNPLPNDAQKCIASWRKFFPDYEIKQWNESNFDVNCCAYVKEAYEAKKYAFVSDYARFLVLFQEGGLYFDTDVEAVKNMDHIIEKGNFMGIEKSLATQSLDRGEDTTVKIGVAPGLGIGAEKGLTFLKEMLDFYNRREHFSIEDGTVVDYTSEILRKHGLLEKHCIQEVCGITIYPAEYFCPMDSTTGIVTLTENTVSIHHYSCSWMDHNTLSWRIHQLKNRMIGIFGEKWIMKISGLLRR